MIQKPTPEPAQDQLDDGIISSEDGTDRSNVTPISPEAARRLTERSGRTRADEIFETGTYEGETLRMGQVLRRVREALGLDLAEISRKSLIRHNFLMAIERMETGTIPKGYLVPYLINYSKYLGLPDQDVIERYTRECGAVIDVKSSAPVPKISQQQAPEPKWKLIAGAVAGVVVLVALIITAFIMTRPAPEPAPSPSIVSVSGARDSLFSDRVAARPASADLPLELVAVRAGWLEVRGADGTIFVSRSMAQGETYFPRLNAGWTISARNGGSFEWRVGETVIAPLGPDGAQVFSISVDAQLARAAEVLAPAAADGSKPGR